MPNRLKRASFARLAVVTAVLAFPLLVSGSAQAAIAGAIPAQTTGGPDVRSATIDPTAGSTGVRICFDKPLNGVFTFSGFLLGGYRAGHLVAANGAGTDPTNTSCAIVTWPASIGQLNQYTFVELLPNTTFANAGTVPNLADSVGLSGSTSHAGTTGVSTGPNLVGVVPPTGSNQLTDSLTYVFDKAAKVVNADRFFFETAAGQVCSAQAVQPAGFPVGDGSTTITVTFDPAGGPGPDPCNTGTAQVVQAVRAGVFGNPGGAATQSTSDLASFNPNMSAILPNCASPCATQRPDLIGATLQPDFDHVVYQFDKNVVVSNPTAFIEELANAQSVAATGAVCSGSFCTASFSGNLSPQAEFGVMAWVFPGAVEAADNPTPSGANIPGSANTNDNAGAFARAFTTGPDVFALTINKTTGVVAVNLDDRVNNVAVGNACNSNIPPPAPTPAPCIRLLDASGAVIAGGYTPSFNASAGPGPEQVLLQYPPSVLTNATQVQFLGGTSLWGGAAFTEPFPSALVPEDAQNVSQVVGQVPTGAILRAYHTAQAWAKTHLHHKHHKQHKHHKNKRH